MQIVLRVTADQFVIGGKGHVAFQNACTLTGGGNVGLYGMLGEHQRRAAVPDGEIGFGRGLAHAGRQLVLEVAIGKLVHQIGRTGTVFDRDGGAVGVGQQRGGGQSQSCKGSS